mmetsp:Transcript_27890/g.24673  ORF Transcript_27890/g.24673 Transcript_27890/m.24673 type:complete len:114 (-) Transcript_27890:56-397(-)
MLSKKKIKMINRKKAIKSKKPNLKKYLKRNYNDEKLTDKIILSKDNNNLSLMRHPNIESFTPSSKSVLRDKKDNTFYNNKNKLIMKDIMKKEDESSANSFDHVDKILRKQQLF